MNRYQFIGNLGQDAQVRTLESGVQTISFTVAITEKWKDKQGQQQERTEWISCTIWKQPGTSTAITSYLKKGQKVLIEGKPTARAYTNKDNQVAASLDVRVDNVELLGGAPQQQGQGQGQNGYQQQQAAPVYGVPNVEPIRQQVQNQMPASVTFEDDLPF